MRRSKNSIRKISVLIFLMILTLLLAITATYAWFSTQRDIEVSGMRLNVEVAESLQISLDGEIWTQSIQIANMRQFYGTYTGTGDGFAIYQAKKPDAGGNTNYVPTELLPVSSAGEVANGKLQFVQGTIASNTNGTTKLTGITACSENDLTATETVANRQNGNAQHPYLVFDMYLRNISAKTTGLDELLLNKGSAVWVNAGVADDGDQEGKGIAGTGLEYSARVGMVVYGNTISTTATDTQTKTIGQQIRDLTAVGNEVAAIWEPNNKEHTAYVVANNGRGISSTSQEIDTYGIKVEVASAATKEIANINSTEDANLVAVDTFTPEYTTAEDGVDTKTIITDIKGNNLGIAPNQISKVRVYVWLEGQDPDCIDLASTGDKLNVTLKLTKDQTTMDEDNSYIGNGLTPGLTAATLPVEAYGKKVTNYASDTSEAQQSVDWKIFHTDGENIYLIADDYIENQYAPEASNDPKYTETIGTYGLDLVGASGYSGSGDISSDLKTKWLSKYKYTNTNENVKATAYLLNKSAWDANFTNSYAEYAIGGPTLELFTESYNETHPDKTIDIQVTSEAGYQVKWSDENIYDYYINGLSTTEDLYVIKDDTNADAMWVASPSNDSTYGVMYIGYLGDVRNYAYANYRYGARPCVVLKPNVQIQEQEDGSYEIIN